jgi:phospholipase/carboxylesterase
MYDERVVYLAPQAAGHTWYPNSFLAPISQNEPWLSSALAKVGETLQIALQAGLPHDRIIVCGFSQGACLTSEFVARNPTRYGAVVAFTGGLIGPPDMDLHHSGNLAGTPALFSSGDPDPHVPWARVAASARQFTAMGAKVQLQRHEGRPHTVSAPELESARKLLMELF